MTQKRNYSKECEQIIKGLDRVPTLLLHACCAPCSSYCLEYLSEFFEITVFYYNPNITEEAEYRYRTEEVKRLISEMKFRHPVHFMEGPYDRTLFFDRVRGLENEPEGGARCKVCFRLRLEESARQAEAGGYDYFTTTLTISPLKNAEALNTIGEECVRELNAEDAGMPKGNYQLVWLPSDFKKKDGYKRSTELSAEYGLYRQDYCGCVFSRRDREKQKKAAEAEKAKAADKAE